MGMLDTATEDTVMDTRMLIHMKKHTRTTRDITMIIATIMIMNTPTTVATNHHYYPTILPPSLTPMPATPILTITRTCTASSSTF
jgi:hypothetical protein